jgi:serine/threonine protein kinase
MPQRHNTVRTRNVTLCRWYFLSPKEGDCLVYELMDGTLHSLIQSGDSKWFFQRIRFVKDILKALLWLHSRKFVHADIKVCAAPPPLCAGVDCEA